MDKKDDRFRIIPGMINVGYWSLHEEQCYNNMRFTAPDFGRHEGVAKQYNDLYKAGQKKAVNFISLDLIDDYGKIDCFLFSDFPRMKNRLVKKALSSGKPMFLILVESEVIYPKNWDSGNHDLFKKIFTWHDDFIDGKKYFRYNIRPVDTKTVDKDLSKKMRLCTMVSSNKTFIHPLELFSKRREVVRWFEKNHPGDFDLYGYGWDLHSFPLNKKGLSKLGSDKLRLLQRLLARKYPSWRGAITNKKAVFEKYRFAICYENATGLPGYISEKIFDCFTAGTVPVYWGASNIEDHVPGECFIDKRNFNSYENLYKFMKGMNDSEYLGYLERMEYFLNSEKAYQFSTDYFVNTVIGEIEKTVEAQNIRGRRLETGALSA